MRTSNHHSQWQDEPLRLTEENKQNLHAVLDDFFTWYHLPDVREQLWDWLVAALSAEGFYVKGIERNGLFGLYEKLETLVEAAYLIKANHENESRSKKKKR